MVVACLEVGCLLGFGRWEEPMFALCRHRLREAWVERSMG